MIDNGVSKRCRLCGEVKPISEYHVFAEMRDGHRSECKRCIAEKVKKRNKEHPEINRNRSKKWREANVEYCKDKRLIRYYSDVEKARMDSREWGAKNKEKKKETRTKWNLANPLKVRAGKIRYKKNHPEKVLEQNRKRRCKKLEVGGVITAKEWEDMKNTYNNTCLWCGRTDVKLTLDHIIPLSLGGENTIQNSQPLCGSCNSKKHTKIIDFRSDKNATRY